MDIGYVSGEKRVIAVTSCRYLRWVFKEAFLVRIGRHLQFENFRDGTFQGKVEKANKQGLWEKFRGGSP